MDDGPETSHIRDRVLTPQEPVTGLPNYTHVCRETNIYSKDVNIGRYSFSDHRSGGGG